MIYLGMSRDELPQDNIIAATFHPFKDIWWVLVKVQHPDIETMYNVIWIEDGSVNRMEHFTTEEKAHERIIELWNDPP